MASDFTPLRVLFFGLYYFSMFIIWLLAAIAVRAGAAPGRGNLVIAFSAAVLFAPSATWTPNHFIATPLVLLFGGELGRPWLALASFLGTAAAVWSLLRLIAVRRRKAA